MGSPTHTHTHCKCCDWGWSIFPATFPPAFPLDPRRHGSLSSHSGWVGGIIWFYWYRGAAPLAQLPSPCDAGSLGAAHSGSAGLFLKEALVALKYFTQGGSANVPRVVSEVKRVCCRWLPGSGIALTHTIADGLWSAASFPHRS